MKVPSDFSHRSKLIEDLINVELTIIKNNDFEIFKNFELLMSSDICQHNLEKAQRKLLKREGMVNFCSTQSCSDRAIEEFYLLSSIYLKIDHMKANF